jgi:NMD protein affecting ribosome stability and mRNA decay
MSALCHNCGTPIDEDEDTLCGRCKEDESQAQFHRENQEIEAWNSLTDDEKTRRIKDSGRMG